MLTVVVCLLLNGVISEMEQPVGAVLSVVLTTTGTQVSLSVPVTLQVAIGSHHQGERTDVEFTVLVKQGFFYVLLNNITSLLTIDLSI